MKTLLSQSPRVSAVFSVSDAQAIGAWYAIQEEGLSVPEDIAIVGYDDIKTSRYIGLSSVDQKMQEVGHRATDMLIDRLKQTKKDAPISILTIPELRIRKSSSHRHGS